jgi:hypothetical protein
MRFTFAILLLLHAMLHVLVFLSTWGITGPLLPALRRTRGAAFGETNVLLRGACWLGIGVAIAVAGGIALSTTPWWPAYAALALSCSLALSVFEWHAVPAAPLGAIADATLLALLWSSLLLDVIL